MTSSGNELASVAAPGKTVARLSDRAASDGALKSAGGEVFDMHSKRNGYRGASNRERGAATDQGSANPAVRYASIVLVAIALSFGFYEALSGNGSTSAQNAQAAYPKTNDAEPNYATDSGRAVSVPLTADRQARFYTSDMSDGKKISFFVIGNPDGSVRAAFNACKVCYKYGKGYRQDGNDMVCNYCDQRSPAAQIGESAGQCNPEKLKASVQGKNVVVATSSLADGSRYF